MYLKIVHLLLILSIIVQLSANYFCSLNCVGAKHTPCTRTSYCGTKFEMLPFDDNSRTLIVHIHNKLRNKIALGEGNREEMETAANMKAVSYNKELEFVAQCYSNACKELGNHDVCRRTSSFDVVGQNMYGVTGSFYHNFTENKWIEEAINSWYREILDTKKSVIDKFTASDITVGHFTQLVWAFTTHVGCGRTVYGDVGGVIHMSIYCNYGIGGNILGVPVYIRGQPCTQCGHLKCNDKYKGLCGDVEELMDDKWTAPFSMQERAHSSSSKLVNSTLIYSFLIVINKVITICM